MEEIITGENVEFSVSTEVEQRFLNRSGKPAEPSGWDDDATILFRTVSGSHLYGLNHAGSDLDYYTVVPSRYIGRKVRKHSIVEGVDTVIVDFKSFLKLAEAGVPQALEAMFSQEAVSEYFEDYRTRYFASSYDVVNRYLRTIKSFALNTNEPFKMRRHSLRLAYNLEELIYTGRFNPRLPADIRGKISMYAEKSFDNFFVELNSFTPLQVNWGDFVKPEQ